MIAILLDDVNVGFDDLKGPDGQPAGFVMAIVDPQSGITVKLPLAEANARSIGNHLLRQASVQIATEMPPPPPTPQR